MIQAIVEELVRIVLARLMAYLFGIVRGQITAQASDGTVTVQCALGEITNVQISQPWPNCTITGVVGCHVLLAWPISTSGVLPLGPGEIPCVVAFLSGNFSQLQISGNRAVARENDAVRIDSATDAGTVAWMAAQDAAALASDVTGAYTAARLAALAAGQVWPPTTLQGKIVEGSDKVRVA